MSSDSVVGFVLRYMNNVVYILTSITILNLDEGAWNGKSVSKITPQDSES